MPASLTSVANLVQSAEQNQWYVRAGDDLPKFLYANGPGRITSYNFDVVHELSNTNYVYRRLAGAKPDYADIFELTDEGRGAVDTIIGWKVELSCSGASYYGKDPPNCRRPCCGGFGECQADCEGPNRAQHPPLPCRSLPLARPPTRARDHAPNTARMLPSCVLTCLLETVSHRHRTRPLLGSHPHRRHTRGCGSWASASLPHWRARASGNTAPAAPS